jgi:predicted component of viral defense system (DUF524 family)
MRVLSVAIVSCRTRSGEELAHVMLTPTREGVSPSSAPLVELNVDDAREHGETTIQLRENERYEYEVRSNVGGDLRLRCRLATRRRTLGREGGKDDAGLIETRSFCGTLLLELVEGEANESQAPVASALLDVRSLKLDYRTQYRGMLRRLSDELAGLVVDSRESIKSRFQSTFEPRTDEGWLQIQVELLRETLDGCEFSSALQRIIGFPHERLADAALSVPTDRLKRANRKCVRQLIAGNPRSSVPEAHPLRQKPGLESVASRIVMSQKTSDLDTAENRFVKYALEEFRAFLDHAQRVFDSSPGWGASARLARRLSGSVEAWLGRGMFREIGDLAFVPLGSPVLQRKAGYRDVLRWWLRFRTSAELSWQGGEDVFRAGQRDVATLYEYWLFFELLGWFCRKCRSGVRPPVADLVDGLDNGAPSLRLRKQVELGPFVGTFAGSSRPLSVRFSYNKRFEVTAERHQSGSWTRRLHPDYSFTFWPASISEEEAERQELLAHLHFDAKYRVEVLDDLFGTAESEDSDEDSDGNYKRQDLLKMHAYRDAIKRSQGAYVLYPGRSNRPVTFTGFHELLPGLGAFGVTPDEYGAAQGVEALERFLDEVLVHLSNRTTAQERLSYHLSESYMAREAAVEYGAVKIAEMDVYNSRHRGLPPAEHMVVAAWYENDAQAQLARHASGFMYVRLGRRAGGLHVHPNLAKVRHMLLRTHNASVAHGLVALREPGFRVFTRTQLRAELRAHVKGVGVAAWEAVARADDDESIYALFRTSADPAFEGQRWDTAAVMGLIEQFESDLRNRPVENLGRTSPYPRILSLRDLLKARVTPDA